MIAGMHAAFLLFHNHAVDLVRSQNPGIPDSDAYVQARRLTLWHYQWMILHEFLPHIDPQPGIDERSDKRSAFRVSRYRIGDRLSEQSSITGWGTICGRNS